MPWSHSVLWALVQHAGAATLQVDDSSPGALQAAIDEANDGDDILVAGGTYSAIEVSLKELHLFGGYNDDFSQTSSDTPSLIEGTANKPAVTLYETGDSILDGFLIRGGERGVFIDAEWNSTTNKPLVRNNIIEQSGTSTLVGGGVYADHCAASFIGNTVRDNIGDRGAGMATYCSTLLVENNVVEGNVSYGDHGGGLYFAGPEILVRGNLVRNNEVGVIIGYGWGAGALVYGQGSSAVFENNVFTENHAQSVGSGAFVDDGAVARFEGDLFYANACTDQGGAALYVDGYDTYVSSHAELVNVTIAGHNCPSTQGNAIYVEAQSDVLLQNSIVWGNGGDDFITDGTSSVTGTYTLSKEPLEGTGNLSSDPLFVDPEGGDFHVRSTQGRFNPASGDFVIDELDSPTIDAGDPASDYALEPGPNGLRVNLGHTGNTMEASMGAPGGVPPEEDTTPDGGTTPGDEEDEDEGADAPKDGHGPKSSGSCGCQATGPDLGGSLVTVGLALAMARRRRR